MEVLKVTLKQHTPLLHFQPNEPGATLRASEVKPKLDKYILSKMKVEERCALDYKLSIYAEGDIKEYLAASYLSRRALDTLNRNNINKIEISPYFAQEKENKSLVASRNIRQDWKNFPKKGLLNNGNVQLTIIGNHEVLELISKYIQYFFLEENFGTRQSKGFGSFTVVSIKIHSMGEDKNIRLVNNDEVLSSNNEFCYKSNQSYNINDAFKEISNVYKIIKSGSNIPYRKSLLMTYFSNHTPKIRWEKKYIKKEFKAIAGKYRLRVNSPQKVDYNDSGGFKFVRALLGLPNQYEFLLENPPVQNGKMIATIKNNAGIERFKSPITFKVIDGYIYIIGKRIPEQILDKTFEFSVSVEKDNTFNDVYIGTLETPEYFDLKKFMEYAMRSRTNFRKIKHV